MPLQPFDVRQVRAGEPVTAQAWNDSSTRSATCTALSRRRPVRGWVRVAGPSLETDAVRVSAIAADGGVIDAAAPVPPSDGFTLMDLLPGSYTIRAEARGFTPATAAITVPAPAPVLLTLSRSAPAMPAIFGLTLEQALAALRPPRLCRRGSWTSPA